MLHAEPGMVGTTFREVLADNRGRLEMHGLITKLQPGASMAVRLEGQGMTVTARYEVSPHPAGTLTQCGEAWSVSAVRNVISGPEGRGRGAANMKALP